MTTAWKVTFKCCISDLILTNNLNLLQKSLTDARECGEESYTDFLQYKPSFNLRVRCSAGLLSWEEYTSFLPYKLFANQGDFYIVNFCDKDIYLGQYTYTFNYLEFDQTIYSINEINVKWNFYWKIFGFFP